MSAIIFAMYPVPCKWMAGTLSFILFLYLYNNPLVNAIRLRGTDTWRIYNNPGCLVVSGSWANPVRFGATHTFIGLECED